MTENTTACGEAFAVALAENKSRVRLTGTYGGWQNTDHLHEAVVFWKTIRERRENEDCAELNDVIRNYSGLGKGNILLDTVAKLELFLVRVFLRVLWFYNIDYQSFESCLRRITSEQIAGIHETYANLYGASPKVPRAFTEGLYNFMRDVRHGCVSVQELLNEKGENDEIRYQSKGAIAFNFFGWDMGFHRYPKENTDGILASTPAGTFLSLTNRTSAEKVFTTNKGEGGVYWWLYKTCRSNYLWNRDGVVEFSKKICPAFWYTVLCWITFLFLSPLAFGVTFLMDEHWYAYPVATVGLITPLILAVAIFKYLCGRILDVFACGASWIEKKFPKVVIDREFWEDFRDGAVVWFAFACGTLLFSALVWGIYLFFGESNLSAAIIGIFALLYGYYMAYYKEWTWPTSVPWIGKPVTAFIIIEMVYIYNANIIEFFYALSGWTFSHLPFVFFTLFCTGVLAAWWWFDKKLNAFADSAQYERVEKIYGMAMFVSGALLIGLFASVFWMQRALFGWNVFGPFFSVVAVGISAALLLQAGFMINLKPRKMVNQRLIVKDVPRYGYKRERFYTMMKKNSWLLSLEDPLPALYQIWSFAASFFPGEEREKFLYIDEKGFSLIEEYQKYFNTHSNVQHTALLKFLLNGVPVEEAKEAILAKKARYSRIKNWWTCVYDRSLGPVGKFFQIVWCWCLMMIHSACEWWEQMNEMCPLESKTEKLK